MSASTFTKVKAGHYQREDGISIRKVDGPTYRRLTGGRCYVTGTWWVAYSPNNQPITGNWPMLVGGDTLTNAKADLDRHEQRKAAAA